MVDGGKGPEKIQSEKAQKRKSPNQGPYMGHDKTHDRFAVSLSQKMERAPASGFETSGCRAEPCDSFPLLSYKESRAPAGQAGNGALRPEAGKSLDHL